MDLFRYQPLSATPARAQLFCEDLPVDELAARFGTPLYVYSAETMRQHARRFRDAFSPIGATPLFAVKANSNTSVLRLLAEESFGMDVVSGGELERAWLAGVPMDRIAFAGVGKTEPEIAAALSGECSELLDPAVAGRLAGSVLAGRASHDAVRSRGAVSQFNCESVGELSRLSAVATRLGVRATACIRVNPDVDAGTHAYITTGTKANKFGLSPEAALDLFRSAHRFPGVDLAGLHVHIGSLLSSPAPFAAAVAEVAALADRIEAAGPPISRLDIGGGFSADYTTGQSPWAREYAAAVVPILEDRARQGCRIFLEPGRTITASAGVLLTRVEYVKRTASRTFLVCDAGMHTLIRPALYDAFHFIWPTRPEQRHIPPSRTAEPPLPDLSPCDVVGPVCESADFLARQRPLPVVEPGALLAVYTAGAYGLTMASNYNSHPLPAEVLVDGAHATLIRRRQTIADLIEEELL